MTGEVCPPLLFLSKRPAYDAVSLDSSQGFVRIFRSISDSTDISTTKESVSSNLETAKPSSRLGDISQSLDSLRSSREYTDILKEG